MQLRNEIDRLRARSRSKTHICSTAASAPSARCRRTGGALGAAQNRFQSTIANLEVSSQNLTASESRIVDTDMSLEMLNFTQNQILLQAGPAMLAQVNAVRQTILKLLQ